VILTFASSVFTFYTEVFFFATRGFVGLREAPLTNLNKKWIFVVSFVVSALKMSYYILIPIVQSYNM
ncbi:hypothetical protein, partial [uncultured Ruminococcus sp.]|uniref:hypothetical protein n=1 Tax=uncultured Ruminococcus sp. TaxID=165186 RepID=UPI0025FC8800